MKKIAQNALVMMLVTLAWTATAQKKTRSFEITRTIEASADRVWAVVGEDYSGISKSHPLVQHSDYINGSQQSGEGCERVCSLNSKGSKYTHETQVKYDPENYTFVAQVTGSGGLPLDEENTFVHYKVVPVDETTSQLVLTMTYRTNPAFMGAMSEGKFKKNMEDYALAIQHYVLTGEAITKENFKAIKKQYNKS